MKQQYEQIQTRKAISAYGGVGSILETRDGSIIVKPFDTWPFFDNINGQFEEHNLINDRRFKNRLSKYFQQLEHLVKIPVNELQKGYKPENSFALLSANYFPEWFYCNRCHRFDHISNWKKHWESQVESSDKENFYPPKCFKCYLDNKKKKRKFFNLEQVRFILTAPNGDIADIPWDKWALVRNKKKEKKDKEQSEKNDNEVITIGNIDVPNGYTFGYKTSDKIDDLKGIWIMVYDENGKEVGHANLSGLFNLRIPIEEIIPNTNERLVSFKSVIRTSNSVYYPNILSSIYLPAIDELNPYSLNLIKEAYDEGDSADIISKNLKRYKSLDFSIDTIQRLIDNNFSEKEAEISKTENEYRFDEYRYITTKDVEEIEGELAFKKIDKSLFQNDLIKSIYKMDKVKIISVQTSFTRQEPISSDLFLKDDSAITSTKEKIRKKYTSLNGIDTKYLPAIESYGEGIFFDFDNTNLESWLQQYPNIQKRIQTIIDNHKNSDSTLNKELKLTAKFILVHTFSHLIIKELEYLCGYPVTSIQERLYIDENLKMFGVLIYTIAGSEGSYGGLTSICESDKIKHLISSAITRAKDCATDPICYYSSGQGVGNLNLSACFSCTLLPETSCEMFNCFLDRRILVDREYGYFKNY